MNNSDPIVFGACLFYALCALYLPLARFLEMVGGVRALWLRMDVRWRLRVRSVLGL